MGQIVEDIFARRNVDLDVVPVLGRYFRETSFHQRFAGRDDLDDSGVAGLRSRSIERDQRWRLHRGRADDRRSAAWRNSKAERAAALACAFSVPFSPVTFARLHRRVEIVVNDREGAGIGVVDADLLRRELMFDQLVFDAFIGERAGHIEAERLEVAGQHLHRGDATGLDRVDEFGAVGEGKILAAPEAEPLGIGEVVDGRGAGRRDIDDRARWADACCSRSPARPCCEAAWFAAFARAAGGVLHGVGSRRR